MLKGRIYEATEAREKGIVQRVVPDGEFEEEAYAAAQRIADAAPLVNRWHKNFIDRLTDPTPLSAEELDEGFHCFATKDYEIGDKAFLEKSKPEFTGR